MATDSESDLDLIAKTTGLLTIEVAFLVVFTIGGTDISQPDAIKRGFMTFAGPAGWSSVLIISALVAATGCASASLLGVAGRSPRAARFLRMSSGLLGLAGLAFTVHVLLLSWGQGFNSTQWLGVGFLSVVILALLVGAWKYSGRGRLRPPVAEGDGEELILSASSGDDPGAHADDFDASAT